MTFSPILKKNPNLKKKISFFFEDWDIHSVATHTSYMMTHLISAIVYVIANLFLIDQKFPNLRVTQNRQLQSKLAACGQHGCHFGKHSSGKTRKQSGCRHFGGHFGTSSSDIAHCQTGARERNRVTNDYVIVSTKANSKAVAILVAILVHSPLSNWSERKKSGDK